MSKIDARGDHRPGEPHVRHLLRAATARRPTGSNPTCTDGPELLRGRPDDTSPAAPTPMVLDDTANGAYDPDHTQACELEEDERRRDGSATSPAPRAARSAQLRVRATAASIEPYWTTTPQQGALADHYFQPIVGQSSSNDMYLAARNYVFTDNAFTARRDRPGVQLRARPRWRSRRPTIGDLLDRRAARRGPATPRATTRWSRRRRRVCPDGARRLPASAAHVSVRLRSERRPVRVLRAISPTTRRTCATSRKLAQRPRRTARCRRSRSSRRSATTPSIRATARRSATASRSSSGSSRRCERRRTRTTRSCSSRGTKAAATSITSRRPGTSTVDSQPLRHARPAARDRAVRRRRTQSRTSQLEHSSIVKFIEWNWLGQTGQLARARCHGEQHRHPARSRRDGYTSAGIAVCSRVKRTSFASRPRACGLPAQSEQARRHEVGLRRRRPSETGSGAAPATPAAGHRQQGHPRLAPSVADEVNVKHVLIAWKELAPGLSAARWIRARRSARTPTPRSSRRTSPRSSRPSPSKIDDAGQGALARIRAR